VLLLQNEAEEALFRAYFAEGRNISDHDTLVDLGEAISLEASATRQMLESDQFAREVRQDEQLGQEFGIRGVPFFVVNRKYGISGAQPIEHFVNVLQKASNEESSLIVQDGANGDSCGIDGCD
jgi:predicted DsbA family dithiol-disulfide isomerase